MVSDRIFGLVILTVALGYVLSATQIQMSFLSDPVGPRTFPYLIGGVMALCGVTVLVRPDPDPDWPGPRTFGALALTVAALVAYAYLLKPLGFLLPTALAAGFLSYQISPRPVQATVTGVALSVGLFLLFRYALGLGLSAVPKTWLG
ncbi:MAG: tripartite tricarboxylate transporter TctB family protein [Rhodobacter sp.]|nr:tripartite tricarboxylate transporter TctB family protein [Rhodobacter sp.]MCY4166846.1 tripartite tricarboxylate transporter TctB family protein [Rhodobacter sp.]MCY4241850.1 tripartite tricarboxylate transporter TctB family protein [Rhodobacter sp.]